ncbi:hypothetical protein NXH76_28985 [Blautia schinkii]|nr:hypothetical protein [Blautia schinkii]
MIAAVVCYSIFGIVIGVIFSLLFINFDTTWKKLASSLISISGSSGIIALSHAYFKIDDQSMKFWTASCLYGFFLISFLFMMMAMCKIIKDKDNSDILRIRDILLGQKSYIEKYYEKRKNEIDDKLPKLEEREKQILNAEKSIAAEKKYIAEEEERIQTLGKKALKLPLPDKKTITLTKEYINIMPSYVSDIFRCINNLISFTQSFISDLPSSIGNAELNSFLISISMYIMQDIFGNNSTDVRIHFRYYNCTSNGYEKLTSIIGVKISPKPLTFIPYDSESMIKRSYECRRALIKSINHTHDYAGENNTVWLDYLTFTFYNLKLEEKPFLSFGISVKNEERYKKLFYFINYFKFELYLQEYVETVDEHINFKKILYGGNDDKNI